MSHKANIHSVINNKRLFWGTGMNTKRWESLEPILEIYYHNILMYWLQFKNLEDRLNMVAHIFYPCTPEAEVGGYL